MNMIERVARVLSPMSWEALNTKCDTKAKAKRRKASLDFAKLSIKIMREPTEEMERVILPDVFISNETKEWQVKRNRATFNKMIDAALKETK